MFKGLFLTTHPKTGLYAFAAVLLGFNFYPYPDWPMALILATTLCFITWNIMSFNDLIDRDHDRLKGKEFAATYTKQLFIFWLLISGVIVVGIAFAAVHSSATAAFCISIWLTGILYSFSKRLVLVQNWMVALCSGSPVLVAGFYYSKFSANQLLIFTGLVIIVAIKETYLDIRDREIDTEYKRTLSSESPGSYINALMYSVVLMIMCSGILMTHTSSWVKLVAFSVVPFAPLATMMFSRPELALQISRYLDLVIFLLIISTLISQF